RPTRRAARSGGRSRADRRPDRLGLAGRRRTTGAPRVRARRRRGRDRLPERRPPLSALNPSVSRQPELEPAALAGLRLPLDLAAERRRQLARDREPEAGALPIPGPERPEDPLLLLRSYPRPAVVDRDPNRSVDLPKGKADVPAVA